MVKGGWERQCDKLLLRCARRMSGQKDRAIKIKIASASVLAAVVQKSRRQAARWLPVKQRQQLLWDRCLQLVRKQKGRRLVLARGSCGRVRDRSKRKLKLEGSSQIYLALRGGH